MVSVQLSIIKLVFKNPCVVKARFCPLDKRIFMKENQTWHIFYRLVSQTSCSILKCLVSVQVLGCTVCFKLINRTSDIITCKHWKHLPFHTYSTSMFRSHISWKVLKIALRRRTRNNAPAPRYKKPSYGPECCSILGSGYLKTTVNFMLHLTFTPMTYETVNRWTCKWLNFSNWGKSSLLLYWADVCKYRPEVENRIFFKHPPKFCRLP